MYVIYKKVIFQSTNICYKSFKNTIKLQQLTQSDTGIGKDKKKKINETEYSPDTDPFTNRNLFNDKNRISNELEKR